MLLSPSFVDKDIEMEGGREALDIVKLYFMVPWHLFVPTS